MFDAPVSSSALQNCDISIKVLLADDSAILRRGIRQLLAAHREIEIVGEAASFAQTLQLKGALNPHVVILDLHMPDEENVSPQEVKSHLNRGSQVLVISLWDDEDSRELAESLGAAAFLDKMNLAYTLIPAIMQLNPVRSAAA
jgi:DNA-binding NarL/FixJ family response regulator